MHEFEFALMLEFCKDVLMRFRITSKALEDEKISLDTCANLYKSLIQYISSVRDQIDNHEKNTKLRLPHVDYKLVSKRTITIQFKSKRQVSCINLHSNSRCAYYK